MTDTQTEPADLDDPSPLACTMAAECPADDHVAGCQSQPIVPLAPHLPVRTGAVGSVLGDLPVIPERNETTAIAQLANVLAYADAVPTALRRKPNDVFLVLLTARDLGVSLTTAIREFHVIEGKVTLSPKVKLAMVRQSGIGKIWPDPANDHLAATWYGERSDMPGIVVASTFTLDDSKRAKLGEKDKSAWKTYPARMLSWRALGFLLDDQFSEVGTGLYQPDELGAVTDADGEPIEVSAVESLSGMKGGRQPDAPPAEVLDADTLAMLRARTERVKAHPEAKADLMEWWVERDLPLMARLTPAQARTLTAKLGAVEQAHGLLAEGPGGEPTAGHDCGHVCCDERTDPHHDHFLDPAVCPACKGNGPVDRPLSDPTPDVAPTAPEPPEPPSAPPGDVIAGLLASTSPKDGDVPGWLIGIGEGLPGAALRQWFRAEGLDLPAGPVAKQRMAWALAVHDRIAVATVRVLSGFAMDAADLEAVER